MNSQQRISKKQMFAAFINNLLEQIIIHVTEYYSSISGLCGASAVSLLLLLISVRAGVHRNKLMSRDELMGL